MSTYLVAFVVCDFAKISDVSQNKVNVSVIASKDKISQAEFALTSATKLMDYYADFFGIPYPLQKQGKITAKYRINVWNCQKITKVPVRLYSNSYSRSHCHS